MSAGFSNGGGSSSDQRTQQIRQNEQGDRDRKEKLFQLAMAQRGNYATSHNSAGGFRGAGGALASDGMGIGGVGQLSDPISQLAARLGQLRMQSGIDKGSGINSLYALQNGSLVDKAAAPLEELMDSYKKKAALEEKMLLEQYNNMVNSKNKTPGAETTVGGGFTTVKEPIRERQEPRYEVLRRQQVEDSFGGSGGGDPYRAAREAAINAAVRILNRGSR